MSEGTRCTHSYDRTKFQKLIYIFSISLYLTRPLSSGRKSDARHVSLLPLTMLMNLRLSLLQAKLTERYCVALKCVMSIDLLRLLAMLACGGRAGSSELKEGAQ